jgi:hypothetical protein
LWRRGGGGLLEATLQNRNSRGNFVSSHGSIQLLRRGFKAGLQQLGLPAESDEVILRLILGRLRALHCGF